MICELEEASSPAMPLAPATIEELFSMRRTFFDAAGHFLLARG